MSKLTFEQIFVSKIKKFILDRDLISPCDKIVLGFSGGADSVALFKIFKELKVNFIAAHVNHNLRKNAARDENFARDFCRRSGVRLIVYDAQAREYAAKNKISLEEAGRELRYFYFNKAADETGANKIATAHNKNDLAETVIMNFIRGSGLKGLSGIPAKNKIKNRDVVRPLLAATKDEIEKFAGEFIYDETNGNPVFTRNRIRLELAPYIEKYLNPNIIKSLSELSTIYKDEDNFLDQAASAFYDNKDFFITNIKDSSIIINIVNLKNVKDIAIRRRVVKKALEEFLTPTAKNINDILSLNQSGKKISLGNNLTAIKEFDNLVIKKEEPPKSFERDLVIGKITFVPELGKYISVSEALLVDIRFKNVYTKVYFYDKIPSVIKVRSRRPGDRIRLKAGTKKLKRVFIEDKVPASTRDSIPLLADGNDILMIMGGKKRESYRGLREGKALYAQLWARETSEAGETGENDE
jgi:tRNA(Ile)-lysidine synthase